MGNWTTLAGTLLLLAPPLAIFAVLTSLTENIWDPAVWGRVGNTSWCEPDRPGSVREVVNSWSNVGYLLVGIYAFWITGRKTTSGVWRAFGPIVGASLFALGIASFLFHASVVRVWRKADGTLTRAVPIALFGFGVALLVHKRTPHGTIAVWVLTLGAMASAYWLSSPPTFGVTVGGLALWELGVRPLLGTSTRGTWLISCAALVMFALSYLVWHLERAGTLCLYHAWFQPHSVWHVGTAVAVALQLTAWWRQQDATLLPVASSSSTPRVPTMERRARGPHAALERNVGGRARIGRM